jgi:cellulose synthase operon protein C
VTSFARLPPREKLAWTFAAICFLALLWIAYWRPSHSSLSGKSGRPVVWSPGEADRHMAAAQAILKDNPEDLKAMAALAVAFFYKGPDFYVDALNTLERARTLGATDESLFYYAGVMYSALGLPEYAANDYKRFLRHRPNDYEAQVRLANVYFQQEKTDEAYALYKQALKDWPNDHTVLFNFAVVSTKKNDLESAEKALDGVEKARGSLPPGGLFQRGEIARARGDEKAAIAFYQQELTGTPDHLPTLKALEAALRRQGDYKAARALKSRISEVKQVRG